VIESLQTLRTACRLRHKTTIKRAGSHTCTEYYQGDNWNPLFPFPKLEI